MELAQVELAGLELAQVELVGLELAAAGLLRRCLLELQRKHRRQIQKVAGFGEISDSTVGEPLPGNEVRPVVNPPTVHVARYKRASGRGDEQNIIQYTVAYRALVERSRKRDDRGGISAKCCLIRRQ